MRSKLVVLLIVVIATPLQAQHAGSLPPGDLVSPIQDRALHPDGTLKGIVVDRTGQPVPNLPVMLRDQEGRTTDGQTDSAGRFRFRVSRGGLFAFEAAGMVRWWRLWMPAAAPPAARRGPLQLTVPSGEARIVRGQSGWPDRGHWVPSYRGGLIALGALTGVIVAVATQDDAS